MDRSLRYYAAFCCCATPALVVGFGVVAVGELTEPEPRTLLLETEEPCPKLGATLKDGRVIVALDDLEGTTAIPLGRRFVVVRCAR